MLTTFLAWAAVGLLARLTLAHVLRQRWKRRWAVSPSLAGAAIYSGGLLAAFAMLPFTPSLMPVPFGLIFGFFVLDAVVVRL
jgi:cyanophycinase-like exopeptidase